MIRITQKPVNVTKAKEQENFNEENAKNNRVKAGKLKKGIWPR